MQKIVRLYLLCLFAVFLTFSSIAEANEKISSEVSTLEKLIANRKYDEANYFIERAEPETDKYKFYITAADFFIRTGKYMKAIDCLKLAFVNATNQKEKDYTLLKRGECYLKMSYYNEASLITKNLIKNSPDSIYINDAYLILAQSYEALGNINEALNYYQKVPPTISAQIVKAKAYVRMKRYNEAVKIFENIIKTEKEILSTNQDIYYYYGEALRSLNLFKEAKTYLSGAKRLTDFKDRANLSLGLISYKENDLEAALTFFNEANKGRDRDAKATSLYFLGKIKFEKGDKKEAKEIFSSLRNNYPTSREYSLATYYLIDFAREEKNYEAAYKLIDEMLKVNRSEQSLRVNEIELLLKDLFKENNDEFIKAFKKYGNYLYKGNKFATLLNFSAKLPEENRLAILQKIYLKAQGEEKQRAANLLFDYHLKKGEIDKAIKLEKFVDKNALEKVRLYDYLFDGKVEKVLSVINKSDDVTPDMIDVLIYIEMKMKIKKNVQKVIEGLVDKKDLNLESYIKIGDYFSNRNRELSLKAYAKALSMKGIKADTKDSVEKKVAMVKQNKMLPVEDKRNKSFEAYEKLLEKEKGIEKIIKELNI